MKKVDIVKVVKNVPIFEKGDLIMYTYNTNGENSYGVVVEDQDPNDISRVRVRSIESGRIVTWAGIHDEKLGWTPCKFVMHLDIVTIYSD